MPQAGVGSSLGFFLGHRIRQSQEFPIRRRRIVLCKVAKGQKSIDVPLSDDLSLCMHIDGEIKIVRDKDTGLVAMGINAGTRWPSPVWD
jgi:hypothetical protein